MIPECAGGVVFGDAEIVVGVDSVDSKPRPISHW